MTSLSAIDRIVVFRIVSLAFAALSLRTLLFHAALVARLLRATLQGRTQWPGPYTLVSSDEARMANALGRPLRLYPHYVKHVSAILASFLVLVWMAHQALWLPPGGVGLPGGLWALVGVALVSYFLAAGAASRNEAAVEWALGESHRTPRSTNEADRETVQGYMLIRRTVRRVWTNVWLILLTALFVAQAATSREGAQLEAALAQPTTGPLVRAQVEAVVRGERAVYLQSPVGALAAPRDSRWYPRATVVTLKTDEDQELLALLLEGRGIEAVHQLPEARALVYRPDSTFLFPELGRTHPRALVVFGTAKELEAFAKGRRSLWIFFSLVGLAFAVHAIHLITTLSRWVRVARAHKGLWQG
jgi:hypothetical protein